MDAEKLMREALGGRAVMRDVLMVSAEVDQRTSDIQMVIQFRIPAESAHRTWERLGLLPGGSSTAPMGRSGSGTH